MKSILNAAIFVAIDIDPSEMTWFLDGEQAVAARNVSA
jgi:hypothetical protein